MSRIDAFENEHRGVQRLDFQGVAQTSQPMLRQYQRRNTFGLDLDKNIYRIFQKDFFDQDRARGFLTIPRASASIWEDPLENPLAGVEDIDDVTGMRIQVGAPVSSYHGLCWTHRSTSRPSDWSAFSHGKEAVRVTTTVGKLMDRMMSAADPRYMQRAWLIEVDYKDEALIQAMQNPEEVYGRMESQGALLALSAAVVRTQFSDEDEVRLLFDRSTQPPLTGMVTSPDLSLVRIPFQWDGFIDDLTSGP